MTDLAQLLPLWTELRASRTEYVLATIVAVEGSGYRKPGARMLIASDGRRAGTISGGCLESEVARKAFWHTEHGPVVRRYSTSTDDGDVPFGMGCGGVVHLLLERSATANPLLELLLGSFELRTPLAIATILEGQWIGQRAYWPEESAPAPEPTVSPLALTVLQSLACQSFEEQHSFTQTLKAEEAEIATVRAEWVPARPGLFVFGAGDDAIPLVRQARQLGWYVAVADGRSNLATRIRFLEADTVLVLPSDTFPALSLQPTDSAVVLTHSLEQDTHILAHLLPHPLAYIGVLGPRRRTTEILASIADDVGRSETQIDLWLSRLHAPMGLDLGGDTPAEIALAIIAEIQQTRHRTTGLPLRQIRGNAAHRRASQAH